MHDFVYHTLPHHVVFGVGRLTEVRAAVERLDGQRALVVTTSGRHEVADRVAALLGEACAGVHAEAVQHVPYETVEAATAAAKEAAADVLVAVGGGSPIGLAKGVALETGLPIVAIPTTYSGSEMTHIWGISQDGRKTTGRDPVVKPKVVLYDPELLRTLPPAVSLTSGVNAMAHAVEALYAEDANPVASLMAEESVRSLAQGLPQVMADPADRDARAQTLYGAWLSAMVLDGVGMALHHKLAHTLGGSFNLPHAPTHTVVLPYAIAYNHSHAPEAMAAIARAFSCPVEDVPGTIQDLVRTHGGPVALKELGLSYDALDTAAAHAAENPYYNPRPVVERDLRALLEQAYHGTRP